MALKARLLLDDPDERTVKNFALVIGSLLVSGICVVAIHHPVPALATLFVLCAAIAVLRFPIVAIVLLLFLTPFHAALLAALGNKARLPIGPLAYWKDAVVIALFVRAVVLRFVADRRPPLDDAGDNFLLFYVFAFLAIAVISPPRISVYPALGRYVEGPLLLLAIRFMRPTRKQLWLLVSAMFASAAVIGAAALIERLGPRLEFQRWYGATPGPHGEPFLVGTNGYRSGSFIFDPLVLGFFLAGMTAWTAALTVLRTRWRPFVVLGFAACAAGLICAGTRSGFIGGGVGVLLALALAIRNTRFRIPVIGIGVLIGGSLWLFYAAAGSGTLVRPASDDAHRRSIERDVKLLVEKPFGYGLGTTDRFSLAAKSGAGQLGATENTYMSTALESGVQGLILCLLALFVTGMRVRSVRRRALASGDRTAGAIAASALGAMIGVAAAGLFLGVHEQVVEVVIWGPAAIALTWPVGAQASREESITSRSRAYA